LSSYIAGRRSRRSDGETLVPLVLGILARLPSQSYDSRDRILFRKTIGGGRALELSFVKKARAGLLYKPMGSQRPSHRPRHMAQKENNTLPGPPAASNAVLAAVRRTCGFPKGRGARS
jgi:hypothetical protein